MHHWRPIVLLRVQRLGVLRCSQGAVVASKYSTHYFPIQRHLLFVHWFIVFTCKPVFNDSLFFLIVKTRIRVFTSLSEFRCTPVLKNPYFSSLSKKSIRAHISVIICVHVYCNQKITLSALSCTARAIATSALPLVPLPVLSTGTATSLPYHSFYLINTPPVLLTKHPSSHFPTLLSSSFTASFGSSTAGSIFS